MQEIETETIKAAQKRKGVAFRHIYDYYSPFLWKVIYRTLNGDMDAATQVLQDVFVKAYLSLGSYRFKAAFSTWLYRIAFTTSLNHKRQRNKWWSRMKVLNEAVTGVDTGLKPEAKDLAGRLLASLSPEERFLLTAREIDNHSFEELEIMIGKSSGSLRTQVSRIKDNLRKEFKHER
jgi:RNA polymerase sigma-70 factor (ECF subfamily)